MQIQALTIDVEDYFQVSAFADNISVQKWDSIEPRVEMNTNRLLDLFELHNAKATFFVLGWVAKRFPDLVKRIVNDGHELASHGMMHQRASDQTPKEFQADVGDTKRLLEGHYRRSCQRLSGAKFFVHQIKSLGIRCFERRRIPIQFKCLPYRSRSLRYPGCTAGTPHNSIWHR